MTTNIFKATRVLALVFLALPFGTGLFAQDSTLYSNELFELGDRVEPLTAGMADILGDELPGPDWEDLFNADGTLKDVYDEFGNPGSNGVPDILDTWGPFRVRRDAAFVRDDVSAGVGTDTTVFLGPGRVGPGVIESPFDLANAYAYHAFNLGREPILYLGLERLTNADGQVTFELNRALFGISDGGEIVGERTANDLQVVAVFADGALSSLEIKRWAVLDVESSAMGWTPVELLSATAEQPAERCNAAGTVCVVCNGSAVDGGPWPNYDEFGSVVSAVSFNAFLEVGLNLHYLLGKPNYENYYETRYTTIQLSTAEDYALGTFVRASYLASR